MNWKTCWWVIRSLFNPSAFQTTHINNTIWVSFGRIVQIEIYPGFFTVMNRILNGTHQIVENVIHIPFGHISRTKFHFSWNNAAFSKEPTLRYEATTNFIIFYYFIIQFFFGEWIIWKTYRPTHWPVQSDHHRYLHCELDTSFTACYIISQSGNSDSTRLP